MKDTPDGINRDEYIDKINHYKKLVDVLVIVKTENKKTDRVAN